MLSVPISLHHHLLGVGSSRGDWDFNRTISDSAEDAS